MNKNTFIQQQKISNFNAVVNNNNDKIAIEFLTLAKWDESEAINLYLNNVSLPNNSFSDINKNNPRIIKECKLNLNYGLFQNVVSFFTRKKDNADYCKDFEGKIRGLVKRGDVFINLLKINKGVIILYNIETKNKLMQQLDMINKDPKRDYLNGVIIFPVINKSEEGNELIKQLSINRFPCYLFCKYKTKEIFYIVDKMEGIFYLDIFKDTLSPKINILNNSCINLQPNYNINNMLNNLNIPKNYKTCIINSDKNLSSSISHISNIQTNKNNYKINDIKNNKIKNNNISKSVNYQQSYNQNILGKNINNINSSNNNNLQNINKEVPKYNNNNKEAFPKDFINNYSSLNSMDNKGTFSLTNKSNKSKNENNNFNNNNINNNNQRNNNNKNNQIVNNDKKLNLNNKRETSKNEKKEYIPDYRDYDLDDELVYNPQLDRFEKLSNVINKLNSNSNNNNNSNNYSNINNNMYNFQDQNIPMTDSDIRKIQDTEMKELEKIEEEKLKKEKEENEKKRREEQKEKEKKELFSLLIPPEPDDNNPDKCIIIFRLPDGKNIERKFLKTDKISLLYDYIRSLGKDIYTEEEYQDFSILQTFPFKNFEDKLNMTLEEEGLFPNSMLQIKEKN